MGAHKRLLKLAEETAETILTSSYKKDEKGVHDLFLFGPLYHLQRTGHTSSKQQRIDLLVLHDLPELNGLQTNFGPADDSSLVLEKMGTPKIANYEVA